MPEKKADRDVAEHEEFRLALMVLCRMGSPSVERLLRSRGYGYEADVVARVVTHGRRYLGLEESDEM